MLLKAGAVWDLVCFVFWLTEDPLKTEVGHVLTRILKKKRLPPCTSAARLKDLLFSFGFVWKGCQNEGKRNISLIDLTDRSPKLSHR